MSVALYDAAFTEVAGVTGYMSGAAITAIETNGTDVVILGIPEEDSGHDCDQMGCGWSHVLVRLCEETQVEEKPQ